MRARIGKDDRIGIVGGGLSGLTAALELRKAGYTKVVLFEKETEVGGKCLTVELDPGVTYELGASSMTGRYQSVFKRIERYGLTRKPVEMSRYFDKRRPERDATKAPWQVMDPLLSVPPLVLAALQQVPRVSRDCALLAPGFGGVDRKDLAGPYCKTLDTVLGTACLDEVKDAVRTSVTGIGYGYIDEVPSAYHYKYLSMWAPRLAEFPRSPREYELFQVGFQGLCKRMAADLGPDVVKRDHRVERITRNQAGAGYSIDVAIHGHGTERLAALILACPLDDACRLMSDPDGFEKHLEGVQNYVFHTILCELKGYPAVRWGFFMHNHGAGSKGPVLSARRHLDSNRVVFYVLERASDVPKALTDLPGPRYVHEKPIGSAPSPEVAKHLLEVRRNLKKELDGMKLTAFTPLEHIAWKYFPHFSAEDVGRGLPLDLEEYQGTRNTYYAGELLDFSLAESVVRYSEHLVRKHFARG